jgi:hypothetical protein
MRRLAGIVLLFVLGADARVTAQPNLEMKASEKGFLSDGSEKWSESDRIEYPDVPRQANLVPLDSELIGGDHDYFIDRASVSMGEDGVLRYTIVVRPPKGAGNVLYEGIRCATAEYKTYAYATSSGEFRPLTAQVWRKLKTKAYNDYHRVLAERYVCDQGGATLSEKQVQKRIAQNDPSGIRVRPRPVGN